MMISRKIVFDMVGSDRWGEVEGLCLAPDYLKSSDYFPADTRIYGGRGPGRLIAHDVLEHGENEIGGTENEIMALGMLTYIRVITGNQTFGSMFHTPEESVSRDVASVLDLAEETIQPLDDPGDLTGDYAEDLEPVLRRIAAGGVRAWWSEQQEAGGSADDLPMTANSVYRCMKLGILRGIERYGEFADPYRLESVFTEVERVVNEIAYEFSYLGQSATLDIDLDSISVYCNMDEEEMDEEEEEDDDYEAA